MKTGQKVNMGWVGVFLLVFSMPFYATTAFADENDAVAGCQSIAVDPQASFELQAAVCNAAESDASTSCASAGRGMCSSPKKDGLMMEGKSCVCLSVAPEPVLTEETPTV